MEKELRFGMETDRMEEDMQNASKTVEFSDQWHQLFQSKPFCLKKFAISPRDKFFEEGNLICNFHLKQFTIDTDYEELLHNSLPEFVCHEGSCKVEFTSLIAFENHYRSNHCHMCSECKKSFPSSYLLNFHIQEEHDAYFKAAVEQGDNCIYKCVVQDCNEKYTSSTLRHEHLVKDHKYPADFKFTHPKIFKSFSKGEVCKFKMTDEKSPVKLSSTVNEKFGKKESVQRIPQNICFGHGAIRAFHYGSTKGQTYGRKKVYKKKTSQAGKNTLLESNQDISMEELQRALNET